MQERKNTVLIIDDEPQIRKMLTIFLDTCNFRVEETDGGKQGVRLAATLKPDIILLDLGLPDMDGKEVVQAIRQWSYIPIIVLSVRSQDDEVAAALNLGADDYVIKPFNPEVLLARINANLRKTAVKEVGEPELQNGPLRMDLVRHEVFLNNEKLPLTPKEYALLRYFLTQRGKMLTHKQILKEVWGPAHGENTQYLRVYVGQLREKIEKDSSNPEWLITEPGIGYRMEAATQEKTEAA